MDFDFTQEMPGHVPEWYVILMVKWALDTLYVDEEVRCEKTGRK